RGERGALRRCGEKRGRRRVRPRVPPEVRHRADPGEGDAQDQPDRARRDRADLPGGRRAGRPVRPGRAQRLRVRGGAFGRADRRDPPVEGRAVPPRRPVVGGGGRHRPRVRVRAQEPDPAEIPMKRLAALPLLFGLALGMLCATAPLSIVTAQQEEDLTADLKTMRAAFNRARERIDNLDFAGASRDLSTIIEPRKEKKASAPYEEMLAVVSGAETRKTLRLRPNRRTLQFITVPVGVVVSIDGQPAGTTTGPATPESGELARQAGADPKNASAPLLLGMVT